MRFFLLLQHVLASVHLSTPRKRLLDFANTVESAEYDLRSGIDEAFASIMVRRDKFRQRAKFLGSHDENKLIVFDSALKSLEDIRRGYLTDSSMISDEVRLEKLKRLRSEVSRFGRYFNRHIQLISHPDPSRPLVIINMDGSCFIISAVQALLSMSNIKQMITASPKSDMRTALLYLIHAKESGKAAEYVHQLRNALGPKYMYCRGGKSVCMIRHICEYIPHLKDACEVTLSSARNVGMRVRVLKHDQKLLWALRGQVAEYPRKLLIIAFRKDSPEYVAWCPRVINVKDSTGLTEHRYKLIATIQKRRVSADRPLGHAWARVAAGPDWYDICGFNPRKIDEFQHVVNAQTACVFYERIGSKRKRSSTDNS